MLVQFTYLDQLRNVSGIAESRPCLGPRRSAELWLVVGILLILPVRVDVVEAVEAFVGQQADVSDQPPDTSGRESSSREPNESDLIAILIVLICHQKHS